MESGKTAGTYLAKQDEEFTGLAQTDEPILIATTSLGRILLVSLPPYPNRFEKLLSFSHKDCEKPTLDLGLRGCCFSKKTLCLFVADDKMYISCYSMETIFKELIPFRQDKGLESAKRQQLLQIFSRAEIMQRWQVRAHQEIIRSLALLDDENVLITTSFDKKVKLWDAEDGSYVDSLQQNMGKRDKQPIAYYNS